MSAPATAGPATASTRFRGMERDRLWSRLPDRTGDPLDSPDGCPDCDGTGVDLDRSTRPAPAGPASAPAGQP